MSNTIYTLVLILALLLGFLVPFIMYSGSLLIAIASLVITIIDYFPTKKKIIEGRKKDLNAFAYVIFKKHLKELKKDDVAEEQIKQINKYIMEAKNYNYFSYNETKKYVYDYERYNYTFTDMLKATVTNTKEYLDIYNKKNNVIKNIEEIKNTSKGIDAKALLKKVNKKTLKLNINNILKEIIYR